MRNGARMREMEEKTPDLDEDGHPLTIGAAQRLFHKNDNRLFMTGTQTQTFKSQDEAQTLLMQGKQRIKKLIEQAKF